MLVRDAIYEVRTLLKGNSDDFYPPNRFIWSKIKSNRSLIYSRQSDKHTLFNTDAWQTIPCFPLETTDISECCNVKLHKSVSKSVYELPSLINYNTGKPCLKIYTLDNGEVIQLVDLDKLVNSRTQKYKFPVPDATQSNDYLIIDADIKAVKLRVITDDPEEVELFNSCKTYDNCGNLIQETCPKPYLELDFNVQRDLWEAIRDKTAKDIAVFYGVAFEDKQNNAKNDSAAEKPSNIAKTNQPND